MTLPRRARRRVMRLRRNVLGITRNEHLIMVVLAIATGLLAGLGAVAVRHMIESVQSAGFGGGAPLSAAAGSLPFWRILLVPALGGLIVGPVIWWFARDAQGHGVPEVMLSVLLRGGKIRPRVALIKAVISAVTIGSGGSAGREGPMVHVGAGLGSTVGQWFHLPERGVKTLVAAGAAGGLAAAFNAPIAGSLFAMEVILGDFGVAAFSPIVISAVSATLVSRAFGGNPHVFDVPEYELVSVAEFVPYTALGILAGMVALGFIWTLYWQEHLWERLRIHSALKPALGGLMVGAIAITFPQVLGIGFDVVNDAMHDRLPWMLLILLVGLKLFATTLTLGSGGVFVPSMFVGAMLGGAVGQTAAAVFPHLDIRPGAYALVGMGALVAGTAQAPITAVLMAFELSGDYRIILPLMVSCIIACLITQSIKKESIYTQKLLWKGISLTEGREEGILKSATVRRLMDREFIAFSVRDSLESVLSKALPSRQLTFPVIDGEGMLKGIVRFSDLKALVEDRAALSKLLVVADVALRPVSIEPGEDLQEALNLLSLHDMTGMPVVHEGRVIAMVYEKEILDLYARELKKLDLANAVAERRSYSVKTQGIELGEGYRLDTILVPESLGGKTLASSGFREDYGLEVLFMVEPETRERSFACAGMVLKAGAELVVMGTAEGLRAFRGRGRERRT